MQITLPQSGQNAHGEHTRHIGPWTMGIVGGISAITLAPYVLPLLGIGSAEKTSDIMHFMGGPDSVAYGTGLAGAVQSGIASIPLIGGALTSAAPVSLLGMTIASGALVTMAATATLGIGGVLLANWMEKHEDPHAKGIRWSKVIRFAALATSALVALPGILGGISVGISFLSTVLSSSPATVSNTIYDMQSSFGATSLHLGAGAAGGLTALLPHFFTCGLAAVPLVGALFVPRAKEQPPQPPLSRIQGPLALEGRVQQPQMSVTHAH